MCVRYEVMIIVYKIGSNSLKFRFSPSTLVSSTNKTDCHDITEKLLKVTLSTTTLTFTPNN